MAGKRSGGKGKAARRQAQMERLAATTAGAGNKRRARERDEAAREAAVAPSAARWLVAGAAGTAAIDVVADLLRLGPRASLRGRGGDQLRELSGHVADLVAAEAVTPSGRPLDEVLSADAAARERLRPSLDLEALLSGAPVAGDRTDRTVRVAEALLDRAAAHRRGEVDLHTLVAPIGHGRHPLADEVEATVRIALEGLDVPAGVTPAVVTVTGGWVAVDPVELFLAAGRGALQGSARDVAGAALVRWMSDARTGDDPRWLALTARVPADAVGLLTDVARRVGSEHPDVAGAALVDLVALRHPIPPPA